MHRVLVLEVVEPLLPVGCVGSAELLKVTAQERTSVNNNWGAPVDGIHSCGHFQCIY